MAGTIFGLPLSQQFDANGDVLAGCKLYLYAAGTSTPSTAYEDFGLTAGLELSFPIVADTAGRIPQFWLDDGSYRVRLVDSSGNEIFDMSSVTALGASSGGSSGGSSVSDASILSTGDFLWQPVSGTRTGFVRANGRTIGSSSSGGTERASSDAEDLFLFLWNNFSNSLCAVSGGRGGSAAADWAANKTIATLDMRGRTAYGLDDMGNTAASIISGATSAAAAHGQETKIIGQANLPNVSFSVTGTVASHTHTDGTLAAVSHTHGAGTYSVNTTIANGTTVVRGLSFGTASVVGSGGTSVFNSSSFTSSTLSLNSGTVSGTGGGATADVDGSTGASSPSLTGSAASGGSGTALATLSPGRAGSWYIRL